MEPKLIDAWTPGEGVMNEAKETSLIDLLRIPHDARLCYEHDATHHSLIPVGILCNRAAGEIERLRAEVEKSNTELAEIADALPWDTRYLDPPDGGDVSLAEQVRRMRAEVDVLRRIIGAIPDRELRDALIVANQLDEWAASRSGQVNGIAGPPYQAQTPCEGANMEVEQAFKVIGIGEHCCGEMDQVALTLAKEVDRLRAEVEALRKLLRDVDEITDSRWPGFRLIKDEIRAALAGRE